MNGHAKPMLTGNHLEQLPQSLAQCAKLELDPHRLQPHDPPAGLVAGLAEPDLLVYGNP